MGKGIHDGCRVVELSARTFLLSGHARWQPLNDKSDQQACQPSQLSFSGQRPPAVMAPEMDEHAATG